ncbi:acyltransferase [Patescibacteria group bacterium]
MSLFKDKMGKELSNKEAVGKIKNRFYHYYLDFKLMLLRWSGHIPAHSIRRGIYKLAGASIGKQSVIHMWCNFYEPKNIAIGGDSVIGDHAFLDGRKDIVIGNHVDIASHVLIYNSEHDLSSFDFVATEEPVTIEDYVFVGPRVTILPGVTLGKGSVVAAGAVVTKDVEPFTIVGGVPAKMIGERKNKNPKYVLGRKRLFQ